MNKAAALHSLAEDVLGMRLPVRLRLWDGSVAGPAGGPTVVVSDKRALRHVLHSPGELGVARAYVKGWLDVEGDLGDGFRTLWAAVRDARAADPRAGRVRITPRLAARAAWLAVRLGALGRRPEVPAAEAQLSGDLHSRERDREAIAHHYDLSNDFYELVLDPQMTYSSGFHRTPDVSLEQAQRDKLDLVCRKLDLGPGKRLVDIGCGWGALALHAAEHHGVHVVGVTLSSEQRDFVLARAAERGLGGRVDVSLRHFRDLSGAGVGDGQIDAIASLEMGEHVGDAEYAEFTAAIHRYLRPGGRVLIQQMSRSNGQAGDRPGGGPFIETYIAPDMHMKPLWRTLQMISEPGLEIRDVQALREHYPLTVAGWLHNLETHWDEAVRVAGIENARVWRLYLVGGALAFEENRMGVDQVLAVKPDADGASSFPLVRDGDDA